MFIPDIRSAELLLGGVATIAVVSPVQAVEHYRLGVCQTATQSAGAEIRPTINAGTYLVDYHGDDPRYKAKLASSEFFSGAKVTLVKVPAHGKVAYANDPDAVEWNWFDYMPKDGYVGRDNFVMQVEKDGIKVRIEYQIEGINDNESEEGICDEGHWKISANRPPLDNASLLAFNSIDYTPYLKAN
jgi:hypothetical protein